MQRLRKLSILAIAMFCLACRSDDVFLRAHVVIPADIPSVSSGVLRLSLYMYQPGLADGSATLVDQDSVTFVHRAGEEQHFLMSVDGTVPAGMNHYSGVRGFELGSDGETMILWDGVEGIDNRRFVIMRRATSWE